MDRYVIREARAGANYPQGNQMMPFSANAGRDNTIPHENIYYGGSFANQFPNMQPVSNSSFVDVGINNMNTPIFGQNVPVQGQMMTGIDPRYLANYSDNSAQYIVTGQHNMQNETARVSSGAVSFGGNYENRSFIGSDKSKLKTPQLVRNETPSSMIYLDGRLERSFQRNQQVIRREQSPIHETSKHSSMMYLDGRVEASFQPNQQVFQRKQSPIHAPRPETSSNVIYLDGRVKADVYHNPNMHKGQIEQSPIKVTPKATSVNAPKKEHQIEVVSRAQRLQALHKSGPRAFSGPVEKVLKWHKALQDIGVFVFYEIVAKCVSVRPGESCSKNLVIRDDSGPAMQVVYYEVDFLLSELKVPSTVRVIGRMMAGTCRLQAFSVRSATGDDVATLPRRAAVAAHHIAKLCKEYGVNV